MGELWGMELGTSYLKFVIQNLELNLEPFSLGDPNRLWVLFSSFFNSVEFGASGVIPALLHIYDVIDCDEGAELTITVIVITRHHSLDISKN